MLFSRHVGRLTKAVSCVPLGIAIGIVAVLYKCFMWDTVAVPLLYGPRHVTAVLVTITKLVALHIVFIPFVISFKRVVTTPAGRVPDAYTAIMPGPRGAAIPPRPHLPQSVNPDGGRTAAVSASVGDAEGTLPPRVSGEVVADGAVAPRLVLRTVRFCKKCEAPKPPRAHHCSACNECVLKYDHHCPWVANCIGFHNYKYFFLFVFYGFLCCCFLTIVWLDAVVINALPPEADAMMVLVSLFLAGSFCLSLGLFTAVHGYFIATGRTTVETQSTNPCTYDMGFLGNIELVLGAEKWRWLLPTPVDDDALEMTRGGVSFHAEEHAELMEVLLRHRKSGDDFLASVLGDRWQVRPTPEDDDSVDETQPMV